MSRIGLMEILKIVVSRRRVLKLGSALVQEVDLGQEVERKGGVLCVIHCSADNQRGKAVFSGWNNEHSEGQKAIHNKGSQMSALTAKYLSSQR